MGIYRMSTFELIPVYDKTAVMSGWPLYEAGFQEIVKRSHGETSLAAIYNDLGAGHIMLWEGRKDGMLTGFCTTRFDEVPQGHKILSIRHLYIRPGAGFDIMTAGLEKIEEFARKYQCTLMRFWTERELGFQRRLGPEWKAGFVEFQKELEG